MTYLSTPRRSNPPWLAFHRLGEHPGLCAEIAKPTERSSARISLLPIRHGHPELDNRPHAARQSLWQGARLQDEILRGLSRLRLTDADYGCTATALGSP